MSDTTALRFAGDVSIEKINLVTTAGLTQNITNQVMAIEIYEDLFSPFITGVINVKESFDLINVMPLIGEEYVDIKIYTPGVGEENYFNEQFYIYKISNRENINVRSLVYQIHFISREAIVDINKNVSKVYGGNIGEIAKDICTNQQEGLETKKKVNVEPTVNTTKFTSNYWSPVKSLNYAAATAANSNGAANYVFFENRRGLNFASLETLSQQPVYQEFVLDNYSREFQSDGRSLFNVSEDYKRIQEIETPVTFDYIDRARSGMFGSKMVTYDVTTKKYVSKNYNYLNDFSKSKHLNEFPATTNKNVNNPHAMVINYPKYYGVFNGFTDVTNAKTIQKRISSLAAALTTKITITVMGRTDYTVGTLVNLNLNKMQPIEKNESNDDIKDNILSGKYLVSGINHYINREKHECTMELIKDSYIIDLNKGAK